ncbi:MAG: GAF domain-containing protein [Nitrospiraceae bacterium]|nr:MAG: GAF domain-containing protein [Nitrospiraceae bacterium]
MTDGLYLVDMEKKIQYWNRAAESITGLSADKMIGCSHDDIMYEDDKGVVLQTFEYPVALCFQEKKVVRKQLYKTAHDSGRRMLEETASPLMEKGKLTGVIAAVRDISHITATIETRIKSERKERLIPICGWCKKIRSDENYWEQLETYLTNEGFGIFTHGMCPSCAETIFEKKVYLESFQNICKAISASISIDEVLHLIVTNVVKVMNVKASLLRLLNKETQQLEIAAYYGLSEKYANKGPVGYDKSIDDALAGEPVSVYDITEHEDSKYYEEAREEGIRSILSIPLRADNEVIGVLRMYTSEPVNYTEDDLKFMSAIAEQGAIAIVNARRFETAVSNEKEYLRVFEEITKTLSSSLDLDEVLNMIVRKIAQVMGLKGCTLRLLNKEKKQLELAAYHGLSEKYVHKGPVAFDASIDDARAGKSVSEYDISEHKDSKYYTEAMEEGIKNILSVPMIYQNDIIGMLRFYTAHQKKYSEADLMFMEGIAEQAAIAIVNARHFEKEISKEKEYLEVFQEVTRALSVSLKPREVLDMIVRKLPEVMNLKAATVRLLDKEGKDLELVASYGLSDEYLKKGPVDAEKNVIQALQEKAVAIYDVTTDERIQYKEEARQEGIKSMLTLPIRARGTLIGILRLLSAEHREFSRQEIDFTASLAEQSGIAILNAQSFEQEISREKEYLRVFEDITKTVSSSLDMHEVLNLIVRKIPEVMGLKGSMLRLINREKKLLELVAYYGLSEKYANKGPVSYDASLANSLSSAAVSVYDIAEDRQSKYYREAVEEGIWSIMSVPLTFQSETIGRLRLYSTKPIKYTDEDTRFMSAIAEQTAIAIVNARHFEAQISKEKQYLEVFEEVTKAVSASLRPADVMQIIVKKIPEVMDLKAATIRLLDPSGKKLKLAAAYGLSDTYLNRGPIDAEKNVIEALKERPVAIFDVTTDRRVTYRQEASAEGIKSMLTVPVIARNKVLGILRLHTGEPRRFSDQEIQFVESLAEQCATAIANALMYEKIKKDYDEIMKYMDGAVCKLE